MGCLQGELSFLTGFVKRVPNDVRAKKWRRSEQPGLRVRLFLLVRFAKHTRTDGLCFQNPATQHGGQVPNFLQAQGEPNFGPGVQRHCQATDGVQDGAFASQANGNGFCCAVPQWQGEQGSNDLSVCGKKASCQDVPALQYEGFSLLRRSDRHARKLGSSYHFTCVCLGSMNGSHCADASRPSLSLLIAA